MKLENSRLGHRYLAGRRRRGRERSDQRSGSGRPRPRTPPGTCAGRRTTEPSVKPSGVARL